MSARFHHRPDQRLSPTAGGAPIEPGDTPVDPDILDEPLLDADQVAEQLGIPKATVYEYARDGRLPCVCLGRHRKFVRRHLAEAIARMRTG